MAKKETREIIPPYKCIQSLELFSERMVQYRMAYEWMLEYVKKNPSDNEPHRQHIIEIAEKNMSLINEFYNY